MVTYAGYKVISLFMSLVKEVKCHRSSLSNGKKLETNPKDYERKLMELNYKFIL